jgi:hypothetical protein
VTDNPIKITIEAGYYAMRSPKDQRLIDELKSAIHYGKRSWNGAAQAWMIEPSALPSLLRAIQRAGYELPEIPQMEASTAVAATTQRQIRIEYLGQCKERDGGIVSALATENAQNPWTGLDGQRRYGWSIEILESALKEWFEHRSSAPAATGQTFYQVLCVVETATADQIKSAYRRLARQWHPDVCAEAEANEMFRKLTDAYEILQHPKRRKAYDAGLFFEREANKKQLEPTHTWSPIRGGMKFHPVYFRAPLRCGLITAEGRQELKKFVVSKILDWQDIVSEEHGMTMTSSWNKATESIQVKWI